MQTESSHFAARVGRALGRLQNLGGNPQWRAGAEAGGLTSPE